MAKRKRTAWIVAGLLVGVLVIGGGWWYHYNNSGAKLLSRARVAINADKFQKAEELAKKYISQAPGDWQGHYTLAVAYQRQGKQEQARTALTEAFRINPRGFDIVLALAQTYWQADAKVTARPDLASDPNELRAAIAGLVQADDVMAQFSPDPNDQAGWLKVQEARGLGLAKLARVQFALAEMLAAPAKVADPARQSVMVIVYKGEAHAMRTQAEDTRKRAIEVLLGVVRKDPARAVAAEMLLRLCIEGKDEASLELARGAIESAGKPPAGAALMLAEYDMKSVVGATGIATRRSRLARTIDRVQAIVDAYPANTDAKCARAELALMVGDWATAERLSNEVIQSEQSDPVASLIHARSLLKPGRGDKADANQADAAKAEKELFSLKTSFGSKWPMAQYWYARAAEAVGKTEAVREAMRAVTNLEKGAAQQGAGKGIFRAAHQYLADCLMKDFPAQALKEAAACYESDPNDPAVLGLYFRAAVASGRGGLARQALAQAVKKRPGDPLVLDAVRNGYLALGDDANATQSAERAASIPLANVTDVVQVLAVANALTFLGRGAEADRLVSGAAEKNPNDPEAQMALASRYARSGRQYQAINQYRRAVALDANTPDYRLALAGALLEARELDEARSVLEPILETNRDAQDIEADLDDLQGKPYGSERTFGSAARDRSGRALVAACITGGQVARGVALCLAELERDPTAHVGWYRMLGLAYLMQGKTSECIQAWSAGIKAYPRDLLLYHRIASVIDSQADPEDLAKRMSAIDGAQQRLVDLAVASALVGRKQYAAAAELYAKVAADNSVNDVNRYHALIEQARALTLDGKVDKAVIELDKLIKAGVQPMITALTKAGLLASAGRTDEAEAALAGLVKIAEARRDAKAAIAAAESLMQLRKFDQALVACDVVQRLQPNEPKSFVLRAMILQQTGRGAEAVDLYRKAVALQPAQMSYHLALAEALDAQNEPLQALEALRQMEALGQPAKLQSVLRQGVLLARWGLKGEAARRLDPLMKFADAPVDQVGLASCFMAAGQKEKARELLVMVSPEAPQHLDAQLMLADLAETPKDKLACLEAVDNADANSDAVLARKMSALMDDDRRVDALKTFSQVIGSPANPRPLPMSAGLAIKAALKLGRLADAGMSALALANMSSQPSWRTVVEEITIELDPEKAAKALPLPQKADYAHAALGLCLGKQTGNAETVKTWADRLDEFARLKPDPRPANLRLLCAMLVGNEKETRAAADAVAATSATAALATAELRDWASRNAADSNTTRELLDLLKAEVALIVRRPEFASFWALRALEARPQCQWAALQMGLASGLATAFGTPLGPEGMRRVAELIEPRNCRLALELRANACERTGRFDEAVRLYAELAEADKGNGNWPRLQASALERAADPENPAQHAENIKKALGLYHEAYLATKVPLACNNWAYLVCEVFPQDKAMLSEARKALDELESRKAFHPGFLDTAGWVAFHQGRTADACRLLRQAVKDEPGSAEIHYHLGLAENAVGNKRLAEMHLERAVAIVKEIRQAARNDPAEKLLPAEAQAGARAETALSKISLPG